MRTTSRQRVIGRLGYRPFIFSQGRSQANRAHLGGVNQRGGRPDQSGRVLLAAALLWALSAWPGAALLPSSAGAASTDAPMTNVLAVYGLATEDDGGAPWPEGGIVSVENLRSHAALQASIELTDGARYALAFVDYAENQAALEGDTLRFVVAGWDLAEPDLLVLTAQQVSDHRIRFDLRILRPGACCHLGTGECILLSRRGCEGQAGPHQFLGPQTMCEPNPCPAPSTGACCDLESGGCVELSSWLCDQQPYPHSYQGDGSGCQPNPCPQPPPPVGACCNLQTGYCKLLSGVECGSVMYNHRFLGEHTLCFPNPCPPPPPPWGACCMRDGTCAFLTMSECRRAGGTYSGTGSVCDPPVCRSFRERTTRSGACCLPEGECVLTTPTECGAQTGSYRGDLSGCEESCSQEPGSERGSWGRIKARYRD